MYYTDEIKERLSMPEVMEYYGFRLNRSGFCCCPFHSEDTPSFKAYSGSGGYHCFGCGAHGDVITFTMQYFGLDFKSAIEKLNEDFKLGLSVGKTMSKREKLQAAKIAFEKKEKIRTEKEKIEEAERNYDEALTEYIKWDKQRNNFKPLKGSVNELSPLYIEAIEKLPAALYKLQTAEMRLDDAKHRC